MDRGREVDEGGPIRVLVVDDHDLFRTGLASLLSEQEDIEVVAQASNGPMGVRLARELRPHVILMDLRLPGIDGVDATRAIVERDPSVRVIALTVADAEADVAAAVLAGASGYLAKDAPMDNVVLGVRAAARGESWLSPGAAAVLMERLRSQHVEPEPEVCGAENLSPRELEVLRLVARGMQNSEIAGELHISPRTAKNHVSSILGKLGLTSRIEAATYAVRRGLG
jgi:DNA-binding NarL/FixJ family response regulator